MCRASWHCIGFSMAVNGVGSYPIDAVRKCCETITIYHRRSNKNAISLFENGADAFSCNRREEVTAFRVACAFASREMRRRIAPAIRRAGCEATYPPPKAPRSGALAGVRSRPHGPARGDPRGWRGRRRRGPTPSGVEPRGDGERAGRACATPRRHALSRGKIRTERLSYL